MLVHGFQFVPLGRLRVYMSPALSGPLRVHLPQGSPPRCRDGHSGLLREPETLDCLCFEWFLKRWPVFSCLLGR